MNGAAVITFMIPSQICKSKQGESVIECYHTPTAEGLIHLRAHLNTLLFTLDAN